MKKIMLLSSLLLTLCLGACQSSNDEEMSIELACPTPTAKTLLATATVTWPAIAKTAGYAYKIDNAAEYTIVEAEILSVKLTKLSAGVHTFYIHAVGNNAHTTDSAERNIEFTIDPTLTAPSPSFIKGNAPGEVVISWKAVAEAAGYAYKFNDDANWTKVAADILSITKSGLSPEGTNTFKMYAIGQMPDSADSPEAALSFKLIDTSEGVWAKMANGELWELTETSTANIFTGKVPCKAIDSFTILIKNVEYGFLAYSGNGGVGTVNNLFATVPFYNGVTTYYVRESIGQMTAEKATEQSELNSFYTNLDASGELSVKIDCSKAVPIYDLKLEQTPDTSVLVEQHFDLFVWGGDWVFGDSVKGSGVSSSGSDVGKVDGTEVVPTGTLAYSSGGTTEASTKLGNEAANPEYIRNRNLEGWIWAGAVEHPGYMHVSIGKTLGKLLTPTLSTLTGSATIIAEIDICRFSAVDPIKFVVTGGGTIKSCVYNKDGATTETPASVSGTDSEFMFTTAMSTPYNVAPGKQGGKKWSHFKFVIEHATPATRVGIDSTTATTAVADQRICVDNIIVRKN